MTLWNSKTDWNLYEFFNAIYRDSSIKQQIAKNDSSGNFYKKKVVPNFVILSQNWPLFVMQEKLNLL